MPLGAEGCFPSPGQRPRTGILEERVVAGNEQEELTSPARGL